MSTSDHLKAGGKSRARLTRAPSSEYRASGYRLIKRISGRNGVYSKIKQIQAVLQERGTRPKPRGVQQGGEAHARRYTFTYKRNFQLGSSPYSNQGHHLLPCEAFTNKYFSDEQLFLLRQVRYDVNNGMNILFLPSCDRDCFFHLLPSHSGPHPKYTDLVSEDMQGVRDSLQQVIDRDPEHKNWSPPQDLRKRLLELQKSYWDYLTRCGPIPVNLFKKPQARRIGKRST